MSRVVSSTNLTFTDLALLYVIRRWWRVHKRAPHKSDLWQPRGGGALNEFLKPCVEAGRCTLVTSDREFNKAVKRLRETEMLWNDTRFYEVTWMVRDKLFSREQLTAKWRKWPLVLPIGHNGFILFDQAEYYRE